MRAVLVACFAFSCYLYLMSVSQTVDIPAYEPSGLRRLVIDVPRDVPAGRTILTFTPAPVECLPVGNARTLEEAVQMAKEKAADPNRKPISRHFGKISPETYGDGVAYQRKLRDEWDD